MKLLLNIQCSIIFCFLINDQSLLAMHASKPLRINPQFLKGTHDVLADTNYAPFWGLAIIDNNLAEQWYKLSAKQQNKENIAIVKNAPDTLLNLNKEELLSIMSERKNAPIQDLVLQMFHIAGGTFSLTHALNNPVSQFTPMIIGQILRKVHDTKIYDDAFSKSMEDFLVTLHLKDPSNKDFKAKNFRPFAKALTASLQEFIQNAQIPLNITQQVLLGFMLCKSTTKADLESYFSGFEGRPVKISDEMLSPADIDKIAETTDFSNDDSRFSNFADFICATIYQNKYAAKLPKMAAHAMINYKKYRFADCVETTMLNLANIVTYDAAKKHLGVSLNNLSISPELAKFYQKKLNSDTAEVDNINVHNDWVFLVENIVGAAYNNIGTAEEDRSTNISGEYSGAIPVPSFDPQLPVQEILINHQSYQCNVVTIDQEKYLLVPQNYNLICFELMPTISNIVVIMNHLFNLNLIDKVQDVFQSDFALKQFEKLCEKFSWSINTNLKDIRLNSNINLNLSTKDEVFFTIHLIHKAHGYVSVKNNKQNLMTQIDRSIFKDVNQFATLLSCGLAFRSDELIKKNYESGLYLYDPIITLDESDTFLRNISPSITFHKNLAFQSYIGSIIINIANSEDRHYYSFNFLKKTPNSKIIVNSTFILASLACIKYNILTVFLKDLDIFINNKFLNKDQAEVIIEKQFNSVDIHPQNPIWDCLNNNYQYFDKKVLNKWIKKVLDNPENIENVRSAWKIFLTINNPDEIWEEIKKILNTDISNLSSDFSFTLNFEDLILHIMNNFFENPEFNNEILKDLEKIDQIILWSNKIPNLQLARRFLRTFINELMNTTPIATNNIQKVINHARKNQITLDFQNDTIKNWQQKLDEKIRESQTNQQSMLDFAAHGTGALRATSPKLMNYNPFEYHRLEQSTHQQMSKQRDELQKNYNPQPISTTYNQAEFVTPQLNQQSLPSPLPLQVPKTAKPVSSMLFMPKASNIKNVVRRIK